MKAHLFRLAFVVFLLKFLILSASAQITIDGTLLDSTDRQPLVFANIALLQSDSVFLSGTTTDDHGRFMLSVSDTGKYFLRVSYLGYGTQWIPLNVSAANTSVQLGDMLIAKSGQELTEVVITAQKPMYSSDGEKKIYNVSEDPSVQGGVANDALQNAPGVYVDMEGNITLRGVSGVEIWINDKPSRISAEGLKSFLQQLPANSIDRIEVITNPSARYSAEGTGGIINIVTRTKIKKNRLFSFGLNGSTLGNYSPWISWVSGSENLTFNAYLSHSGHIWESKHTSNGMVLSLGDTVYTFNSESESESLNAWNYGHISLTWDINKKNTVDVWFGGSFSSRDNNSSASSQRTMADGEVFDYSTVYDGSGNGSSINGGLSYVHHFKKEGHDLTLDAYYWDYSDSSFMKSEKIFQTQTWENMKYTESGKNFSRSFSGEAHYTNPLRKNRTLEVGGEFSLDDSFEDSPIDTFNFVSNVFEHVPAFSNHLDQHTLAGALYSTYSDTLSFLRYKVGLRYEYASLNMQSVALTQTLKRSFSTLFPTLHLSTQSKSGDNYSLSYSRRVRYPQYELDPFANRLYEESVSFGNPYLDPAFTDAYEAAYAHYFKSGSSVSTTVYHRRTNLDITNSREAVFDSLLNRYTIYMTFVNAGKNINTGGDITLTYRPKPAWRFMLNFNMYNQDFYADLGSYVVDKHEFTWDSKLIIMWNYKFLRLNVMGVYRAASASLQGTTEPAYFTNATVNADLFDKKLSIRLGMQDIFNWQERRSNTNTPTYIVESYSKNKSQFLTFGITFRFGKVEMEQNQMPPQGGAGGGGQM